MEGLNNFEKPQHGHDELPPDFDQVADELMDQLLTKPYEELDPVEKAKVDAYMSALESSRRKHLQ